MVGFREPTLPRVATGSRPALPRGAIHFCAVTRLGSLMSRLHMLAHACTCCTVELNSIMCNSMYSTTSITQHPARVGNAGLFLRARVPPDVRSDFGQESSLVTIVLLSLKADCMCLAICICKRNAQGYLSLRGVHQGSISNMSPSKV